MVERSGRALDYDCQITVQEQRTCDDKRLDKGGVDPRQRGLGDTEKKRNLGWLTA